MHNWLDRTVELMLDLLFPRQCVACREFGAWWCVDCQGKIELTRPSDMPLVQGSEGIASLGFYHEPILRAVIHALKYRGGHCILPDIERFVRTWSMDRALPWAGENDLVIQPLVGAPRRIRERGFDQADLLARTLGPFLSETGRSVDLLKRRDSSMAQAMLEHHELRQANVQDMFMIKADQNVPRAVLLIDDVLTSGSTLSEAARVLREHGVERIYGFVLAVGK